MLEQVGEYEEGERGAGSSGEASGERKLEEEPLR